ncbi:MAG: ATP synthase F1 subunit epsilon [Deltaproteobacteria bacterium]|nr:ATP synthase F1 subunit epsilon [Deltaproteobacteria bacterium]
MKLQIVTPEAKVYEGEAEELYAYGPKGEFGVLPGHVFYVSSLEIGRLYFRKGSEKRAYVVDGGFLVADQDSVQVLADKVELADQLNKAEVEKRLADLDKRLTQEDVSPEDFDKLFNERQYEEARLSALDV